MTHSSSSSHRLIESTARDRLGGYNNWCYCNRGTQVVGFLQLSCSGTLFAPFACTRSCYVPLQRHMTDAHSAPSSELWSERSLTASLCCTYSCAVRKTHAARKSGCQVTAGERASVRCNTPAAGSPRSGFLPRQRRSLLFCCLAALAVGATSQAPAPQLLALSSTNVSQVVSSVTTSLSSLSSNASAAQLAQAQILSSLVAALPNTTLAPSAASNAAALVLAVVTAVPGVSLSAVSQSAALQVLAAVSSSNIDATSSAGVTIVSALSTVASSAASGGNYTMLAMVASILDMLSSNLAVSLLANVSNSPGAPPSVGATFTTPNIQMLVQVDPPGSTRLTTQPLTAPGSASSFSPMPAGLFSTAMPVVTYFLSTSFNPYNSNLRLSGMTRLAFSNPSGPIVVANLTTPITFSLPAVQINAGSSKAACMFWDTVAATYSTVGCVTLPNPVPSGHTVQFIQNFTAANDTQLAMAWTITGPLTSGCTSAAQAPSLRTISGNTCQLVQPANSFGCSWSNAAQAFVGSACVVSAPTQQCMCRHVRAPLYDCCSSIFLCVRDLSLTCILLVRSSLTSRAQLCQL